MQSIIFHFDHLIYRHSLHLIVLAQQLRHQTVALEKPVLFAAILCNYYK